MHTRIHQPIPIRRTPTQVPTLLNNLRPHRSKSPVTSPQHLTLGLAAQHQQQRPMRRIREIHRPCGLR